MFFEKVYASFFLVLEYIHQIADAILEKVTGIVADRKFTTMLSDGSQARKTNDKKKLVLHRIEKEDVPVDLVESLLDMADFGGTDTHSFKNALDSVFNNTGNVMLVDYQKNQLVQLQVGQM